jgi:hypothetical protein
MHGRAFGNRDVSIHILKDGTLDHVFESLEKLLGPELCPCGEAIFCDGPGRFWLETMLTCELVQPRSVRFGDAFACKRIDLLLTLGFEVKDNARMESLVSELKSEIYYVGNREGNKSLHRLFDSTNRFFSVLLAEIGTASICIDRSRITH